MDQQNLLQLLEERKISEFIDQIFGLRDQLLKKFLAILLSLIFEP